MPSSEQLKLPASLSQFSDVLDLPNLVTGANLVVGCVALIAAWRNQIAVALVLLLVIVLMDHLDGFLARAFYASDLRRRAFGKQLDNFNDFQNFAVLPFVLFLQIFPGNLLTWVAAASLNISAAFRSSRAPTDKVQDGVVYDGLPTTFSAFILLNLFILHLANVVSWVWPTVCALALALLQTAHFTLRKPGIAWMMTIYAISLGLTCSIAYLANVTPSQ